MALHDEEQRRLSEIERALAEENPRLDQRLSQLRGMRLPGVVLALLGALCSIAAGLFVMVAGAQTHSPFLMVFGTVFTSGLPTLIIWRLWLRKLS